MKYYYIKYEGFLFILVKAKCERYALFNNGIHRAFANVKLKRIVEINKKTYLQLEDARKIEKQKEYAEFIKLGDELRNEILNKGELKLTKNKLANLQLWFKEHEPGDEYKWKKAWWERNIFIRDKLLGKLFGYNYKVIDSHYSKSIECPVILVKYKKVEIVLQYNFYYWQIMVKSSKEIELKDLDFCNADCDYFCYQGIPNKYQFKRYSETNKKKFAVAVYDNLYDVYAFMIMLKIAIDNKE